MAHYQQTVFGWVAADSETGLIGVVICAAGVVAGFYGVRMLRVFLPLICAELGYGVGVAVAEVFGGPPLVVSGAAAALGAITGLAGPRSATTVASGLTWAILGGYLAKQLGAGDTTVLIAFGFAGTVAIVFTFVSRSTMTILLTSLHGAAWLIIGFVGVTAAVMPVVSETFRSWAQNQALVVPVLLGMLATTGYSCQANSQRGDLRVGAVVAHREPGRE